MNDAVVGLVVAEEDLTTVGSDCFDLKSYVKLITLISLRIYDDFNTIVKKFESISHDSF